ncbi:MAG: hypothetical protein FWD73_03435 [Polyangiaceae bacterium]|nr:hypothetical protein [Polyangiaceae bacterium]
MRRLTQRQSALVVAIAFSIACSGGKPTAQTPQVAGTSPPRKTPTLPEPVTDYLIASIGERTIGPFLARKSDGVALVAWVTAAEGRSRRILATLLEPNGEPRGPETVLANAGIETNMLIVRPSRGPSPGFVVAWTTLTDRGEALWALSVSSDGAARGKPVELARTSDTIVWVDVVPTDAGATCLWAEETHAGDANVMAAALDTDGKVRGAPARVARGVTGWHAVELPGGLGLSTVSAPPTRTSSSGDQTNHAGHAADGRGGMLSFVRLDADARAVGAPVTIADSPTVSGDMEVVRIGDRLLFAWTCRTTDEPFVAAAFVDEHGAVAPLGKIVEARGGASLVGLASGPSGAALMWESPTRRIADSRHVHIARINGRGELEQLDELETKSLSLETQGRAPPEIVAAGSGFAVLATARDCNATSPACADASFVPTLVRIDDNGRAVQREPLTFGSDPASMSWGVTCDNDRCLALAASGSAPDVRVRVASVRSRVNLQPEPVRKQAHPLDGPRLVDLTAVVTGETVVDFATMRIGDATMIATLAVRPETRGAHGAQSVKGSRGDRDEERSPTLTLATRILDAAGVTSAPVVLSPRATAAGGVAIAPAAGDGGVVAWVARESGNSSVHIARIDARGKRTRDVKLTTTKTDASNVAIAKVSSGWIVAWVDSRDGNAEVYATKVGPSLRRIARDERITSAPGDASDLAIVARGDLVWLAWADSRESPNRGMADIYACAIRASDAKRAVAEQRLLATVAHSRTPKLALAGPPGNGVHIAWIEEAPLGVETPSSSGYGAMWTTLDGDGKLMRNPTKLPFGGDGDGAATAVAIDTSTSSLHAIIARSTQDTVALDSVDLSSSVPQGFPMVTLDGPPSLDVALVLDGNVIYFNDSGPSGAANASKANKTAGRVRMATLKWR